MIIWSGQEYTLDSTGNGAFVTLTRHLSRLGHPGKAASVFLQGDEAVQFGNDRDALEDKHPDWHGDMVLGWLWSQHGYGDAATPVNVVPAS